MANNSQKAQLHILKEQLGMSDDEYREALSAYGVSSSADPDFSFRDAVELIKTFRAELAARQGSKGYHGWGKDKYEYLRPRPANMADPKQLRKLEAMWRDIADNPSDKALQEFVYRLTKKRNIVWLEKPDARAVLSALKNMKQSTRTPQTQTDI